VSPSDLVTFLRRLADGPADGAADADLVERFLAGDEGTFEPLVRRHGPMVYRVCLRTAGHAQDAEDAFQATFLVLARNPRAVRNRASLASWLHGTARRIALKAKTAAAARQRRERSAPTDRGDPTRDETAAALDEELGRLPDRWRLPLVLCYLEGRTQDEAAAVLGWSRITLRRRLDEARDALGARLVRRGVSPAALAACDADVPAAAVEAVVRAATGGLACVPSRILTLMKGVGVTMTLTRAILAGATACLVAVVGLSASLSSQPGRPASPVAGQAPNPGGQPEPAWKQAFRDAYGLTADQLVKRVAAPYPKCRADYLAERFGRPEGGIPFAEHFTVLRWKDGWAPGHLARHTLPVKPEEGISVVQLLDRAADVPAHRIEGAALLDGVSATGDYVVRDGADPEKVVAQLQAILRKECGLKATFRFKDAEGPVRVLTGRYEPKPLDGRKPNEVELYAKHLGDRTTGGGGTGSFDEFLAALERHVGCRVAVEKVEALPAKLSWHYNVRSPMLKDPTRGIDTFAEDTDAEAVLANVAAQTGLKVQVEKRKGRVLVVEPAEPGK